MDVIDMESYESGYQAGRGDGYRECRRDMKRLAAERRAEKEEQRERELYFLKQKAFGLLFVLFPFIVGMAFGWDLLATGIITIPLGLFVIFSDEMWLLDTYMLEHERREEMKC